MGVLDRFRKKKGKEKTGKKTPKPGGLETVCGDDKEAYEALSNTMFVAPKKITTTMKEAAKNARKYEKEGDLMRAVQWYQTAGGLAIVEGDVRKVRQFYRTLEKLVGKPYPIMKEGMTERALAKAKKYYDKYPEGEKEEKKEEKK